MGADDDQAVWHRGDWVSCLLAADTVVMLKIRFEECEGVYGFLGAIAWKIGQ